MSAYFLRYFYVLTMFLTSTMGFCTATTIDISKILTANLVARINGGYTTYYDDEGKKCQYDGVLFRRDASQKGRCKGEQPDLETCAAESWAMHGVDPKTGFAPDKDEVTQWYMEQFGYTKEGRQELKGFNDSGQPSSIIVFDESYLLKSTAGVLRSDEFWQTFKKVASHPVGRVLLYRILIELSRQNNNYGCQENGVKIKANFLSYRNQCRQLTVVFGLPGFIIETNDRAAKAYLYFSNAVAQLPDTVLASDDQDSWRIDCTSHCYSDDVALFHELVHYYHCLRNIMRYQHARQQAHPKDISELTFKTYIEKPEYSTEW